MSTHYTGVAQAMEELRQAGLDEEGVGMLQKLYGEVRAEEEKQRENKENQREGEAAGPPSDSMKLGGLANGVISRLVTTLTLMLEVAP
jgi:hypothetical protein